MPPGMRETLYFKDDDARLSFLHGQLYHPHQPDASGRLSASLICASAPSTSPSTPRTPSSTARMLGNKNAVTALWSICAGSVEAGIVMNGQIVICPGWNDGDQPAPHPAGSDGDGASPSCSHGAGGHHQVPQGPCQAAPRGRRQHAAEIIDIVDEFGRRAIWSASAPGAFSAPTSCYLRAGRPLPEEDYYEELPPAGKRRGDAALAGGRFSGSAG